MSSAASAAPVGQGWFGRRQGTADNLFQCVTKYGNGLGCRYERGVGKYMNS